MTRRRGRPPGSSSDDYTIGVMCGLLWRLGPLDARSLARLTIEFGWVPRGGSDTSRIDRLARKLNAGNFRADTKEWRAGATLGTWLCLDPASGRPLLDYYDTSECVSIKDVIKLARRKRGPKRR